MPSIFPETRAGAGPSRLRRARSLISEHGADARRIADGRAQSARDQGQLRQMQEWRKVGVLIDRLLGAR